MKLPGPDHPITIEPAPGRVTVAAGDEIIAASDHALILREANYPPVYYLPREDAVMEGLEASEKATYCPYKGEASYFSIPALGEVGENAVWSYEMPYSAVADIVGCLAFYPDRVTITAE
jgi:uncharacterized protein (DUF427 family)